MYHPIHHYVGQVPPSSSAAQPSDPLAGVPADEAFTAGVVLASRATLGMVLGGVLLYSLGPSLGVEIPRWALTLLGGTAGLLLGTYAGIQGAIAAMPSLQTQPNMQDWLSLAPSAIPNTPTDVPNGSPSSSSHSSVNA